TRSLSFHLHRRRSRRRPLPASMAKKKPPKKKPSGRLPTGVTKSPPFSQKSSAPDSSSAAKSKPKSDLPLTGSTAQMSQTPSLAQEDPKSSLAKQTETTDLETLAAATPPASSKEADVLAPALKEAAATTPALQKEASKREGKKPIKSLLPIVGQPSVDPKNANLPVSQRPVGTQTETAAAAPAYKEVLTRSPLPFIAENMAPLDSQSHSGSSVSVSHDLSKGSLCVDLSAEGCFEDPQQISTGSSGSSSDTPASEEGEILSDDGD
ncbi:hypothetical protein IGI04_029476, partial [Brassica rapa subsp. trilocularis]